MDADQFYNRYRELQSYVGWTDVDAERVVAAAPLLEPYLLPLIDDFYDEIERHPNARKVITGGPAQIERLKGTLVQWIRDLLAGRYDADYVARRWRVGWRHVEIGLDQVYTNVALSRLRTGLIRALHETWRGEARALKETVRSLNRLLDLDLAIIEDAYQSEYMARLKRSERMATLGQVAGGVAHELRNPLNVVKTSVYYLLNARNPTPEKQADHLRRIERNVDLADGVITALSNFAKVPVPNLRPIAIEPLLSEALEINPPGEAIAVTVECPPDLPHALGDGDQLRIALGNLIRNARDAMPQGGRLTIETRNADLDDRYADRHTEVRPGRYVLVAVSDTGHGMDAVTRARIFEPFFTTKEIGKGTGLGLAMVYGFVKQSGGHVEVYSEPGHGTSFKVYLPRAEAVARSAKSSQGIHRVPKGAETVLLVEDEDAVRTLSRLILQSNGYTVLEARDGQEGVRVAQQHAGPIHLLVTDLVMPRMSGRQLADRLTQTRTQIRVLFMSGYTDEAVMRHGVLEPDVVFLQKPFSPISLARKVREVLDAKERGLETNP
jgi:two-component system NtrC family sensor kinase